MEDISNVFIKENNDAEWEKVQKKMYCLPFL